MRALIERLFAGFDNARPPITWSDAHHHTSMNRRIWLLAFVPALAGNVAACRDPAGALTASDSAATCRPSDGRITFAFSVAVRDSILGTWLSATVRAQDGFFAEELGPGPGIPGLAAPPSYFGVADRPGTYTVTVTTPGYRSWRREGIVVMRSPGCHVATVGLTVLLQPAA
jgi:hypothetical protein